MLSLCCGDGSFENSLVEQGVFRQVTGFDISLARVNAGNAAYQALYGANATQKIWLEHKDVNSEPYGEALYDVVFAKSSLHHIENLEHAFRHIGQCLKPGGKLVTIDFFGPTRFQWTEQQLKIRSWFWRERVPSELRKDVQGREIPEVSRPDVDAMIAMDPSEAVRSGELYPLLKQHLTLTHDAELGGGLVNLLLYGDILNSFDPDNETHNAVIREAFSLERMLMDVGTLNRDFRLIVAEPSVPSPQPQKVGGRACLENRDRPAQCREALIHPDFSAMRLLRTCLRSLGEIQQQTVLSRVCNAAGRLQSRCRSPRRS